MHAARSVRKSVNLRGPQPSTASGARRLYLEGRQSVDVRGRGMPRFGTLNATWMVWDDPAPAPEGAVLEQSRELDKFLAEVERRAFRMAQIALRDPDDALDVVQDAMLKLARSYGARPSAEWRPLFYRILENGIRDLQRRRTVRKKFMVWLPGTQEDPDNQAQDPLDNVADAGPDAPELMMRGQAME